jgi:transcriptional regulator with XRE-family HTH domain
MNGANPGERLASVMATRVSEGREKQAVAARLMLTRQVVGLSQGEFADRAGLAANTYNQYESAKNMPSLDSAHRLCDAYSLTLDWIYRGDPSGLRYEMADAIKALRQVRHA